MKSDLAWSEASVRTRVVSWKEAADSHESVAREAFVMPISIGPGLGRRIPFVDQPPVLLTKLLSVDEFCRKERRITRTDNLYLAQHLTHDQLDVLVVDVDALATIDLLDLFDEVPLGGSHAANFEDFLGVERAFGELGSGSDLLALGHPGSVPTWAMDTRPRLRPSRR